MDSIVKDLSFVGKTSSKIGLIISIVISLVLLYLSYMFFSKSYDFLKTMANIKNVKKCNKRTQIQSKRNTNNIYNCIITVEYTVDDKLYTNDIITDTKIDYSYYDGNALEISYNPKDPNQIKLPGLSNKTIGLIFLVIAIIVFGIGYYSNYLAQNSTAVATTQGLSSLASIVGLNKKRY